MTTQELLDKIAQLPQRPDDQLTAPPIELVVLVVRWERSLRHWKASTLADFAQVSVSSVERVERREKVSDEVLDKIAQAFGYEAGRFTKPRIPLGTDGAFADLGRHRQRGNGCSYSNDYASRDPRGGALPCNTCPSARGNGPPKTARGCAGEARFDCFLPGPKGKIRQLRM